MVLNSWVAAANQQDSDFPLGNLPYGVFRHRGRAQIGVAIGSSVLGLRTLAEEGLLGNLSEDLSGACRSHRLNELMGLGPSAWASLRRQLTAMLAENAGSDLKPRIEPLLAPMSDVEMQLPAEIGDFTDFYASIHHAARMGRRFRPDTPLLPNYKYLPIGYHGRASSIVVSGTGIHRPSGQVKVSTEAAPVYQPSQALDFELEMGFFIGAGNPLGTAIPIAQAEEHIFGLCLVNDWSARDIQPWEYQPLGPFLAKSFATTISPWVVPLEALAIARAPAATRPPGDPAPLPYLAAHNASHAAFDLTLEVYLQSNQMRARGMEPALITRGNMRELYWTMAQLVTHHASNGCNLRPGDLLATGAISGAEEGTEGCLMEKQKDGGEALRLPGNEPRRFLEDGDTITFRAYAVRDGLRVGFGACTGTILEAE
ncbi:MAG: fumarylacetoacetase [Acidobacteriota bacterium]